jgi:hypothetical protein
MKYLLLLIPVVLFSGDHSAPAGLFYNRALAALSAGDLVTAEFSAEKAAVRGGPEFMELRDFLFGNTSFARCKRAEAEADKPAADPAAYDPAIAFASSAFDAWCRAAASRTDWPAARRNVERALLKLEELRGKKEAARQHRSSKKMNQPEGQLPELVINEDLARDGRRVGGSGEEARIAAREGDLTAEQITGIFEKLSEKEKEKLALRRARRDVQKVDVERDW